MSKRRRTRFSLEKSTNKELIRLNLMLVSMYILVYEVLYDTLVGSTKDHFNVEYRPSKKQIAEFENQRQTLIRIDKKFTDELGLGPKHSYDKRAREFKDQIGIVPHHNSTTQLLIHCTKWLITQDVLTDEDLQSIESILAHRHEVVHELPILMSEQGFEVEVELFQNIYRIIRKADLFWFRLDIYNTSHISDEQFISPRIALLQIFAEAVQEYSERITIIRNQMIH